MNFRKIDIDALDEDQYLDDDELATAKPSTSSTDDGETSAPAPSKANISNSSSNAPRSANDVERDVANICAEVAGFLNKGKYADALAKVLQAPPAGRDPQGSKVLSCNGLH